MVMLGDGSDISVGVAVLGVCDIYVGGDAFLLVAALIWSCMLQPDENMLVSAAWAAHGAPEQHFWLHRHNQTGISELPRLGDDLGYLQN